MAYFDTKKDSLEEAIKAAVKNEKIDAVNIPLNKKCKYGLNFIALEFLLVFLGFFP